jgi:hypothetical protein
MRGVAFPLLLPETRRRVHIFSVLEQGRFWGGPARMYLSLLIQASAGRHAGIVLVRADNDPHRDMKDGDVARALRNLETAGVPIANELHILNHWR